VDVMFLDAPYSGSVELSKDTIRYLQDQKFKRVGLYASVQFVNNLERVEKRLEELGIAAVTSRADRTHVKGQLLGCDNYHDSLRLEEDIDCYLYIGDGRFHPLALVYGQKDSTKMKEIVCNDPIQKKMTLMGIDDIKNILKKYRGSLMKFFTSKTVGILVTIKPGQEQLRPALELEKKYPDKRFYIFVDNVISFDQLENFNFIDVWVNTACPRVGFDDQEKFMRGVINLNDALLAQEVLSKDSVFNNLPSATRR